MQSLFHSRLGGLWFDRTDAAALIDQRLARGVVTAGEAELLRDFCAKGYLVLEGVVAPQIADQVQVDVDRLWAKQDPRLMLELGDGRRAPLTDGRREAGHGLLDVYAHSEAALEAVFAFQLQRLLRLLLNDDVLAFQSVSLDRGSPQPVRQDTARVRVSSPLQMVAAWIALEDVEEIQLYEGSHRLPDSLFDQRPKHLATLQEEVQRRGFPPRKLRARKGDVLLRHADLVHGGSHIAQKHLTVHYCPASIRPAYFDASPGAALWTSYKLHCRYASAYHRPRQELPAPPPPNPNASPPAPRPFRLSEGTVAMLKPFVPPAIRRLVRRVLG